MRKLLFVFIFFSIFNINFISSQNCKAKSNQYLQTITTLNNEIKNEREMFKTEIQSLKNTIKEAESSIVAMKTEIQTLKHRSIEAASSIAGVKTEVQSLKDSSREAESNIVKINQEMIRTKYEEYYIYSSNWANTITSKDYSPVPGLMKVVNIKAKGRLKITAHFHFLIKPKNSQIRVVILINGVFTGWNCENEKSECHGFGVTALDDWQMGTAVASRSVAPGDYTIEVRARVPDGGLGYLNGIVTLIEVYYD